MQAFGNPSRVFLHFHLRTLDKAIHNNQKEMSLTVKNNHIETHKVAFVLGHLFFFPHSFCAATIKNFTGKNVPGSHLHSMASHPWQRRASPGVLSCRHGR